MEVSKISIEEFETLVTTGSRRAPYGQNQSLLKKAENEPMKLEFPDEKKAVSKLTALYVVRRKMDAQVKILRRANILYIGPGEYVPTLRKTRKK
jgi:hypothetical protein